ncbi:MAG: ParA family protein [Rhodobacteraceae bacterium]|jgi:chromosome partitioning protein|nr:ParA family protein [Paracoccaceae bacterium]
MTGTVITLAQQKGGSGKTTLAVNLAVAFARAGRRVAAIDTDPQGSLGRWFMARAAAGEPGLDFGTASAWGVEYEARKLARTADIVIVDTPPKADSDLRPALRAADLVLVPVAASALDLWATAGVLDLARREGRATLIVLNRVRSGTRLAASIASAVDALGTPRATAVLGNRVAFAETLGAGGSATDAGRGAAAEEIRALADEIARRVGPIGSAAGPG